MRTFIHFLDISGALLALISTIYYVKADILAWPSGLISSLLNMLLFGLTGIYGDMGCEFVYVISMFYGWYLWTHPKANQEELAISKLSLPLFWKLLSVICFCFILLSLFLMKFTNSRVPLWDSSTAVLALTAQWMTCKKILECWYLWLIVDVLYVGLYFYKDIPAHGILFTIYLGLAITGMWNWRRLMNISSKNSHILTA